jgi:hypothetical protein
MAIGLILGVALVMAGLVLLCHLSYTNLSEKVGGEEGNDDENPTMGVRKEGLHNDCFLPCCFFQVARVTNHETWIVFCLLCGATVLVLSLV